MLPKKIKKPWCNTVCRYAEEAVREWHNVHTCTYVHTKALREEGDKEEEEEEEGRNDRSSDGAQEPTSVLCRRLTMQESGPGAARFSLV